MKPVGIVRTTRTEGPGYFASFLERKAVPATVLAMDAGDAVPKDPRRFSGLVFMGGPMSVNDDLPWIAPVLALIRSAARDDVPTLGHCLGGQLISKAFGGVVTRNRVPEIGWGGVQVEDNGVARQWFGDAAAFESFHWHGETFTIPPGATRVLSNAHCTNQGFALGKHLGLQCHVEMTEEMVQAWCREGAREIEEGHASPGVQPVREIERDLGARIDRLHQVAGRVYERWLEGLSR
ncbi:MAG TPA: type 1 glutamine amidotransferase [Burkholderiales bacterium]|nr:type 1 glutamine amidotransferase [Burkholderiales bacterium]